MRTIFGHILVAVALATSVGHAWAQAKPKNAQTTADVPLQTQKPVAPPVATQQLPAQPPQSQKTPGASPPALAAPGEVFLMPVPKGWKQFSAEQTYNIRTMQFVPEGKTPEKSDETLRSLVFSFVKDAPLEGFLMQAAQLPKDECKDLMVAPPSRGLVNGYEAIFTTRFCTKSKKSGQGEVTMLKLIQGKFGLYLGERTWRVKPYSKDKPPVAKEVYENWSGYMRAVTLCVPDDAVRPCPKGASR